MILSGNLKLKKPENTDPVDVADLNDNMDILDREVNKKLNTDGRADTLTVEFKAASKRDLPTSNESVKTTFGKLQKWLSDLKDAAFYNVANNLTTSATGSVLDARQGLTLKNQVDAANKRISDINSRIDGVQAALGDQIRINVNGTTCTITRV